MKKLILLFIITLTACTTVEPKLYTPKIKPVISKEIQQDKAKDDLLRFYKRWKGTPYLWGGIDKFGIDCSAFVQRYFQEVYEINIPRTTTEQMEKGNNFGYANREIGDLIFFRTSDTTFHVGIYYENDNFFHASSSRGVTMSNLNEEFWQKTYLKIRRMNE